MANTVSVRKPTAFLKIPSGGAGQFVPDQITVVYPVDNFPYASASFHKKDNLNSAVEMIKSASSAGPSADIQNVMFQSRFAPDSEIVLNDGENSLTFEGYASDPKSNMSPGSVGNTLTIGHEASLLNALRLSSLPEIEKDYRTRNTKPTGTVAERFEEVTKQIVENYESAATQFLYNKASDPGILSNLHEVNKQVLPIWYKILENTEGATGWTEIAEMKVEDALKDQANISINSAIKNILKRGSDGFMGTIRSLTSNFQLAFVPSLNQGEFGKFISWGDMVSGGDDSDLAALDFTQANFSGGSPRILPVSNVVVEAFVKIAYRDDILPVTGPESEVAKIAMWPTQYNGGTIMPKPAPVWFPSEIGAAFKDEAAAKPNHDIEAYIESKKEAAELERKADSDLFDPLLQRYARNYYNYASLLNATASIQIPMDVTIAPGKVYNLRTAEGAIGKGFLQRVTHTMRTGGKSSTATTSLLFSHVEFTGFELPNK